jgi:predicted DNA-binding protein (MmcQ/YjbR family)
MAIELFDEKQVVEEITKLVDVSRDNRYGKGLTCYIHNDKVFVLLANGTKPVKLSLLCEPLLAKTLRNKYETVMPGERLNKKKWNTVLLTGQLDWQEVIALINHSYLLTEDDNY